MLVQLKALWASTEPSLLALVGAAPLVAGILIGYLLRGPIHLLVAIVADLVKVLLKL